MDRDDRLGPSRDRSTDEGRVHQEVVLADVDEDRCRTCRHDCDNGGSRGIGHGDDFVSRTDAERLQRKLDGVRAVVDAYAVCDSMVIGELLLEHVHALAEDELSGAEDRVDTLEYLLALLLVLVEIA